MWYFFSQKVDGKMAFADYWKVLVLNFSVMENMNFFWVKKLMEKMIFTDYRKFLVLNFLVVGNTVFLWVKKLMEKWYILVTKKLLFWTFRWWETRSFFQPKSWWKDDIYLVFLSFPWYSRTWKIGFIVQWLFWISNKLFKNINNYLINFKNSSFGNVTLKTGAFEDGF